MISTRMNLKLSFEVHTQSEHVSAGRILIRPDSYSDCGEKCLVPLGGQHRHSYGTQSSRLRVQDIQRYVIIFSLKATYLNYMWDPINFSKIIAQIETRGCQEDQLHVLDYKYPFGKQIVPVTLKNS